MSIVSLDYNSTDWSGYVEYCETNKSGLVWKQRTGARRAGKQAGTLSKYKDGSNHMWRLNINGKQWAVHRIILLLQGVKLELTDVIDHIDGDPSNNLLSNLRVVSQSQNCRNRILNVVSNTGEMGCSYCSNNRGRYYIHANITIRYKTYFKHFSVDDLGYSVALSSAVGWREEKIKEMLLGHDEYTQRHGYKVKM